MKMSLSSVLDPTIALTKKLFWRSLGIFLLISAIEFILSLFPLVGYIAQIIVGGVLGLGLFLSMREVFLTGNAETSLLDRTSHFAFKKDTFFTLVKFTICNFLIVFSGYILTLYVISYRLWTSGAGFSYDSMVMLVKSFDPLLLTTIVFGVFYTLIVSGPAILFAIYIGAAKLEPSLLESYKKSFLVCYTEWSFFLKLSLLLLAPILSLAFLVGVVGLLAHVDWLLYGLGSILMGMYGLILIPFALSLRVVLIRELFESKTLVPLEEPVPPVV